MFLISRPTPLTEFGVPHIPTRTNMDSTYAYIIIRRIVFVFHYSTSTGRHFQMHPFQSPPHFCQVKIQIHLNEFLRGYKKCIEHLLRMEILNWLQQLGQWSLHPAFFVYGTFAKTYLSMESELSVLKHWTWGFKGKDLRNMWTQSGRRWFATGEQLCMQKQSPTSNYAVAWKQFQTR